MASTSSPVAAAMLPRRRQRASACVGTGLVLLSWGVFLVAWLALQRTILPHIDEGRPRPPAQARVGAATPGEARLPA